MSSRNCDKINKLISKTLNTVKENIKDISPAFSKYTNNYDCIKCNICGSVSGTMKIITHQHNCKYKNDFGPFIFGNYNKLKNYNLNQSELILQREYAIINKYSNKRYLASVGCSSCVILALRDSKTNTLLSHIDHNTLNPLNIFTNFDKNDCSVDVIGGNTMSKNLLNKILNFIKKENFHLNFSHIIDSNVNNYIIDCMTGNIIVNCDNINNVKMTINKDNRLSNIINRIDNYDNLNFIKI